MAARDFEVQAGIADVLMNNRLVLEAARTAGVAAPPLEVCHDLYAETLALGHGAADMAAVIHAMEARSGSGTFPASTRADAEATPGS